MSSILHTCPGAGPPGWGCQGLGPPWPSTTPPAGGRPTQTCCWSAGAPPRRGSRRSTVGWCCCRCCWTTRRCTAPSTAAARSWTAPPRRHGACRGTRAHHLGLYETTPSFKSWQNKSRVALQKMKETSLTSPYPPQQCCERSVVGKHKPRQFSDLSGWWLPPLSNEHSFCF